MLKKSQIMDFIIENEIATESEVDLVCCIAGYSEGTLNSIIYARTAMHDIEQLYQCAKNEFYFNNDILEELKK